MIKLSELLDLDEGEPSKAAQRAQQMGLDYLEFGRWGKDGKVTHKSQGDTIVPIDPAVDQSEPEDYEDYYRNRDPNQLGAQDAEDDAAEEAEYQSLIDTWSKVRNAGAKLGPADYGQEDAAISKAKRDATNNIMQFVKKNPTNPDGSKRILPWLDNPQDKARMAASELGLRQYHPGQWGTGGKITHIEDKEGNLIPGQVVGKGIDARWVPTPKSSDTRTVGSHPKDMGSNPDAGWNHWSDTSASGRTPSPDINKLSSMMPDKESDPRHKKRTTP